MIKIQPRETHSEFNLHVENLLYTKLVATCNLKFPFAFIHPLSDDEGFCWLCSTGLTCEMTIMFLDSGHQETPVSTGSSQALFIRSSSLTLSV